MKLIERRITLEIGQAISYTTIAMNKLGYSSVEIEEVTNKMLEQIRGISEQNAEELADEIIYRDRSKE